MVDANARNIIKLLDHDVRWEVVQMLSVTDMKVNQIVARLEQPINLVSYHLRQLRDAGLVSTSRGTTDARDIYYSLNIEHIDHALEELRATLLRVDHSLSNAPVQILFACYPDGTHVQMAAAIARQEGEGRVQTTAAVLSPKPAHPAAEQVMEARGMSLDDVKLYAIRELQDRHFDYVVTLCDSPDFDVRSFEKPPDRVLHWVFVHLPNTGDVDEQIAFFDDLADGMTQRIRYFLHQIGLGDDDIREREDTGTDSLHGE